MTNELDTTTPRPEATRAQILSRYEGLRFECPVTENKKPKHTRGPRKSNRKTRTIL